MRLLLESGVCTVLSTCWYELLFDQSAYQQHGELRWPKLDWTKEKHSFLIFEGIHQVSQKNRLWASMALNFAELDCIQAAHRSLHSDAVNNMQAWVLTQKKVAVCLQADTQDGGCT